MALAGIVAQRILARECRRRQMDVDVRAGRESGQRTVPSTSTSSKVADVERLGVLRDDADLQVRPKRSSTRIAWMLGFASFVADDRNSD